MHVKFCLDFFRISLIEPMYRVFEEFYKDPMLVILFPTFFRCSLIESILDFV